MNIRTTKGIAATAVVIGYLLMSSVLSWAATTVYVYQAASSGALTIKTIDETGTVATPANTIPNSCAAPDLFWDSDAGALRLNGFGADKNPIWTGTINANGQFATTMTLPTNISCNSVTASVVSALFPDTIPTLASSQACTGWQYGNWTPASCAAGSIQTRTATGTPSGCVGGFPDQATVQSCPAPTCTTFTYACLGTCSATTSTCTAQVTSSLPAGCIGGSPAPTITCTPGVACTGYNYSAWGTCTNGSQSRTYSGYTPAGCSGTPSVGAVLTQSCSTTTPPTGGVTVLPFNGTSQSFSDTITPGSTKIYSCTIPAGQTSTRAGMALVDQYAGMDMLIVQGTQTAADITSSAAQYYTDVNAWYSNSLNLGMQYYKTYPPTVWAKRDPTSTAGETVTLKQSTAISSSTTTTLPGTYYIIVKNANTTKTIRYYLYWKIY